MAGTMTTEVKQFGPTKEKADQLAAKFYKIFATDKLRFKALPGVTTNWSPEKLVVLYQFAADPEAIQQDVAETLNIDRSGVSRKTHGMDWPKFEKVLERLVNSSFEEAIKFEAAEHTKKVDSKNEVKLRTKLVSKESFFTSLETKLLEANKAVAVPAFAPTVIIKTPKNKRTAEHMVLLLSDLHVGEEFDREETGNINQYNKEIFLRRANNLQKAIPEILGIHSEAYSVPELHILCLGDMVQGGNANGEWGPANIGHMDVYEQATVAAKTVGNMIRDWERYFSKVSFTGVIGNHGRGGATKNSDGIGANWDNVCYSTLRGEMVGSAKTNVEWSKTWWFQKNIMGTEFLLLHGDYCRSGLNSLLSLDQKMRGITSKVPNLPPFNILCVGHFHNNVQIETSMGRVMVNGSFPGSDMHSLQHLQSGSKPSQVIFGVHPRRGITWQYWLDLETDRE